MISDWFNKISKKFLCGWPRHGTADPITSQFYSTIKNLFRKQKKSTRRVFIYKTIIIIHHMLKILQKNKKSPNKRCAWRHWDSFKRKTTELSETTIFNRLNEVSQKYLWCNGIVFKNAHFWLHLHTLLYPTHHKTRDILCSLIVSEQTLFGQKKARTCERGFNYRDQYRVNKEK